MQSTNAQTATALECHADALVVVVDNRRVSIDWGKLSPLLANATAAQREKAELSPGGYGIHWPELDEVLSVSGLRPSGDVATGDPALADGAKGFRAFGPGGDSKERGVTKGSAK